MKTYKTLSIVFIVTCLALMAGVLFFMEVPTGHKIVLTACLAVVVFAMVYNLRVIRKKQTEGK
jgi:preprotein translocase subunit SecG